ncbi:MAG TPA: signal peptidase I [Acholeplasmataceae bacterium]|nr:MAG: signal peptidase I [Tenericutes bacterium GWE2_38_8]HBG32663.1 signal peptidase I [Acholeplasmataceae bacterium]HBY65120.1 signal peptidase I [Acholeplasmataceae bacterium]HCB66911.1 signal peptidase I [Acholeplasmataceae bacterium]
MRDKVWHVIKNIIFYLLVILLGGYILVEAFLPSQTMNIFRFKSFVVVSASMEPDINVNDLVIIVKVDPEKLEVGDAISFYTYLPTNQVDDEGDTIYLRSVVTHYLRDIQSSGDSLIYKTQGAIADPLDYDEWNDINGDPVEITESDIIGKVALVIPFIGIIMKIFYNPILLLLIAINILIVIVIIKVIKKK